jgi:hypothetical protein
MILFSAFAEMTTSQVLPYQDFQVSAENGKVT